MPTEYFDAEHNESRHPKDKGHGDYDIKCL